MRYIVDAIHSGRNVANSVLVMVAYRCIPVNDIGEQFIVDDTEMGEAGEDYIYVPLFKFV